MGFINAMKGSIINWGYATGNCIDGVGYIRPEKTLNQENHKLMVSSPLMKDSIVFGKQDIARVGTLFATGEWVKYRIVLKDGKEIIVTVKAMENGQQNRQISKDLMTLEWWLAGVIYK